MSASYNKRAQQRNGSFQAHPAKYRTAAFVGVTGRINAERPLQRPLRAMFSSVLLAESRNRGQQKHD